MALSLVGMWKHPAHYDDMGHLVVRDLEQIDPGNIVAPFEVKRVYCLYGSSGARGNHAHRKLEQIVTCPVGSCTIDMVNRERRWSVRLDHPTQGLYIGPGTWRVLRDFSPDCVLVVLASEPYDESDYIRDPDEFMKSIRELPALP